MFICASKSSVRTTVRKASETRPNWESERSEAKRPNYRPNHTPFRGVFGRFGHALVWRPIRCPKWNTKHYRNEALKKMIFQHEIQRGDDNGRPDCNPDLLGAFTVGHGSTRATREMLSRLRRLALGKGE